MIQIKNIAVYSESDFIPKVLGQTYKDFQLTCSPYDSFGKRSHFAQESIVIVDINNQMVFDNLISPYLALYTVYPLIMLIPNELVMLQHSYTCLIKPLRYQDLYGKINGLIGSYVQKLSQDMFLNHKTLSLIRIAKEDRIETRLTDLEFKILKYILEHRVTTEKAILSNVFGYNNAAQTNTLKVHMHRLKQKLGPDFIERKENGQYIVASLSH